MSYDLTMYSPTWDTSGKKYGSACLSGGHGSYTGAVLPASGDFMVQGWVKTTDSANIQVAFCKADAFWVGKDATVNARAQYGSGGTAVDFTTTVVINDGAWHHMRLEVGSFGGRFYVDGTLAASSAISATTAVVQPTTRLFEIRTLLFADFNEQFTWSGSVDDVAVFTAVNGANFTPAQVSPSASNLRALWALDSSGNDTTTSFTTIAPNNAGFVYSPYTWEVNVSRAKSINSGSYFRTLFGGNTCVLNFDISNASDPKPQIWARVDATGAWTQATLAATVALTVPSANAAWPKHFLEVMIKSTSQSVNRWNSPQNTAVLFTGITLDVGSSIYAPSTKPLNILFYGDSITEGVRAVNNTDATGTNQDDALLSWSPEVARMLGAEFGNIGFGSQGFTSTASGNVPQIQSSYNLLWSGTSRTFSPAPNLVILEEGTNDNSTDTTSYATTLLNGLLAAVSCPIVVLRPFRDASQASFLQAAIAACNSPSRVHYLDTTGYFDTSNSSDALHPFGAENITHIAPQIVAAVKQYLPGGSSGTRAFAF